MEKYSARASVVEHDVGLAGCQDVLSVLGHVHTNAKLAD